MISKLSLCVVLVLLATGDSSAVGEEYQSHSNEQTRNHTAEEYGTSCMKTVFDCSYCDSLEWVAMNTRNCSMLHVHINSSEIHLRTRTQFSHLRVLSIITHQDYKAAAAISCSTTNAGIVFEEITNITLHHLIITNCSLEISTMQKTKFISALTIMKGTNVNVSNLVVQDSFGVGLTIFDHQGGSVIIKSSRFHGNSQTAEEHNSAISGGLYVGGFVQGSHRPSSFQFQDCIFERNVGRTYLANVGDIKQRFSGGGATFTLDGGVVNVTAVFSRCKFVGNEALLGGGLAVTVEAECSGNVSVMLKDSNFEANGYHSTTNGGGMYANIATKGNVKIIMYNVTLSNNSARFGGGLYISASRDVNVEISSNIEIEQCKFEGNLAHKGSAVAIAPDIKQTFMGGYFMEIVFKTCTFLKNGVFLANNTNILRYGVGTLHIDQHNIALEGKNCFKDNVGTAIYVINGIVNMSQGDATFTNNLGYQGGAMALFGESSVIVGPGRVYKFSNNTALERGGVIYVQQTGDGDISIKNTCFLQYCKADECAHTGEWNTTFYLAGNCAKAGAGHVLFATSLLPCQPEVSSIIGDRETKYTNISEVLKLRGIILEGDQILEGSEVSTQNVIFLNDSPASYRVIPGKAFAPNLAIIDEVGNRVESVLTAVRIMHPKTDMSVSLLSGTQEKIVVYGKPGQVDIIQLQTTSHLTFTRAEVILIDCPIGFIFNENTSECKCNHEKYIGMMSCDNTMFHTSLLYGYWAGMLRNSRNNNTPELVTSFCPLKFCTYDKRYSHHSTIVLPQLSKQLDKAMCGESRTGIVCGKCAEGYTTHFHSPNFVCHPVNESLCKIGWLFYILSELVPVTVVFITVIVFNISFTSGAVNGFILYSQLLNSLYIDVVGHSHLPLPNALKVLRKGFRFVYRILNLNFFQIEKLSFCLWPQASAIDMTAFKYVTVAYALVLVIAVVMLMNKCGGRCLGRRCRITTVKSSIIHGVSAFLVLCYSQCVKISLELVNSFPLHAREGSNLILHRRVWLNGNIVSFSAEHLPYALPALFCLLTIGVLPPVLLLAYPLSNKLLSHFELEESKIVQKLSQIIRISTLKPLLDSFQGCFKDNLRFFAGLYFLYRWIAPLLTVVPLSGYSRVYTAMETIIIFILVLHTTCQPYAKKCHNTIDTLLFANLAIVNAFTFMRYHAIHDKLDVNGMEMNFIIVAVSMELMLTYLPLIVVLAYVLVRLCRHFYAQNIDNVPIVRKFVARVKRKRQDNDKDYNIRSPIADDIDYLRLLD